MEYKFSECSYFLALCETKTVCSLWGDVFSPFRITYLVPHYIHTSLPPSFHSVKMTVFIACLILETSSFWDHRTWVPPLPYSLPGESPPFFIRTGLTLLKNPYCQYLEGFPVLKLNSYSLRIIRYFWNLVTVFSRIVSAAKNQFIR